MYNKPYTPSNWHEDYSALLAAIWEGGTIVDVASRLDWTEERARRRMREVKAMLNASTPAHAVRLAWGHGYITI